MDQKILQSLKRVQIGAKMLFSQIRYRAKPKSKYLFCKKSLILCITTNFGQDKNNFKLFQFSTHLNEHASDGLCAKMSTHSYTDQVKQ